MFPLCDLAQGWITDCEARGLSRSTLGFYSRYAARFCAYLATANVRRADELLPDHITGYLACERRRGCKPSTVRGQYLALHAWTEWLIVKRILTRAFLSDLRIPKAPDTAIVPFSRDDLAKLLDATACTLWPERERAILLVLMDTGMRSSELCGLRDDDLREDRLSVVGKGGKFRTLPLEPPTLEAIDAWREIRPAGATWLFIQDDGKQMTRWAVYSILKRLGKLAGITGVRCSPHTVRHSAAIGWLRSGGDLLTLKKLLGHSRLQTTERYVRLVDDDLIREHREHSLVAGL